MKGMQCIAGSAMYFVLYRHWNIKLPHKNFLVIACGHKFPPIVKECDSITWLEVMIVFLAYLPSSYVPLIDFVVVAASDE
jgi:uncharacterized membrane protein